MQHTIHRFHSKEAAEQVRNAAQELTNVRLEVVHKTCSDNTPADPKKYGEWVIVTDAFNTVPYETSARLFDLIQAAMSLALAKALRYYAPHHPLTGIWHLKEDTFKARYHFDNDGRLLLN